MAKEVIEEIKVRGKKPRGDAPGGFPGGGPAGPVQRPGGPGPAPPGLVFLPPATVVSPVEEIIVTAKRQAVARSIGTGVARFAGWPLALLSGIYSLDRYRAQLASEQDAESKRDAEIRRLNRLRREEPLPEIIVRAPAPAVPALPQLVPARVSPLITPDTDPFIMVPFEPLPMPQPTTPVTTPDVEVAPITAPTVPLVQPMVQPMPSVRPGIFPAGLPLIAPRPLTIPQIRPEIRPRPSPETAPAPSVSPQPAPAPSVSPQPAVSPQVNPFAATNPATQVRVRRIPLTRRQPAMRALAEAQMAQNTGQKRCKPCKEDNEPRDKCYRKMVKEALLPRFDQEYEWAEIDCLTGREI